MEVVYFSVIRDVLYGSVEFEILMDYIIPWVQCKCSEYQVRKFISRK